MSHSGILAGAGQDKEKVNYRLAKDGSKEKCGTCAHFYPANSCEKVRGNISPDALCDLWELIDSRQYRPNKKYFQKEYEKEKFKKEYK